MQRYQCFIPFVVCSLLTPLLAAQGLRDYDRLREKMVQEAVIGAGVKDQRVMQAIRETPRHEFVGFEWRKLAYFDMALPIGDRRRFRRRSSWPT